jgi:glutamate 5-kinase
MRSILVVKVGSATLVDEQGQPRRDVFERLADDCASLTAAGTPVILVTSGAVALGLGVLERRARPGRLDDVQAAAAIGQAGLQAEWATAFARKGVRAAQMLLTIGDINRRAAYVNTRRALRRLVSLGVVPVINENDTTADGDYTFGDNDRLAAHVAVMTHARLLVLLTGTPGVYDRDPRLEGARVVPVVIDESAVAALDLSARGSSWGSGGMASKVSAARMASESGVEAVIASGHEPGILPALTAGATAGTRFPANDLPVRAFKLWLRHGAEVCGRIVVDGGARHALVDSRRSLLPVGVTDVTGDFAAGDVVELADERGGFAVGVSEYSRVDLHGVMGRRGSQEVVRREKLVLL